MGLDLVEYVIALEGAFGIEIPDREAAALVTPRILIDYLMTRVPVASPASGAPACLTQRAFYRARSAAVQRFAVQRRALAPATDLRQLLADRAPEWEALRLDLGARAWPRLRGDGWWSSKIGGVATLGDLARHLALYDTALLRPAGVPWTRTEVEALTLQLLERETGVDMGKHTLDSHFVRDMRLN